MSDAPGSRRPARLHAAGAPAAAALLLLLLVSGCAPREMARFAARRPAAVDAAHLEQQETIARDPLGYLQTVARRCRQLEHYTFKFTRIERRGLLGRLHGPEHIACRVRRRPLSVYMKWLDEDVKYGESAYVEGGKVRFAPRRGWFGGPPTVTRVGLMTPVVWGEARHPLSEFGLERLMQRTLDEIQRAGPEVSIVYHGVRLVPDDGRPAHALEFRFSPRCPEPRRRELYIDLASGYPACVRLMRSDGRLEAAYWFSELDTDVRLEDADFVLEAERRTAASGDAAESERE